VVVREDHELHRGDVVVFADPGGWLAGEEVPERGPIGRHWSSSACCLTQYRAPDQRVIGMPLGVVCCDAKGRISVNGIR
jgi:signal peptidase I